MAALARLGSKRLTAFLGPCIEVCTDCEQECRKHADKHPVCKSCADACARFIAEAKKVVAESKKHHNEGNAKIDHAHSMWKAKAAIAQAEAAATLASP